MTIRHFVRVSLWLAALNHRTVLFRQVQYLWVMPEPTKEEPITVTFCKGKLSAFFRIF
jgi:hypothetical protein